MIGRRPMAAMPWRPPWRGHDGGPRSVAGVACLGRSFHAVPLVPSGNYGPGRLMEGLASAAPLAGGAPWPPMGRPIMPPHHGAPSCGEREKPPHGAPWGGIGSGGGGARLWGDAMGRRRMRIVNVAVGQFDRIDGGGESESDGGDDEHFLDHDELRSMGGDGRHNSLIGGHGMGLSKFSLQLCLGEPIAGSASGAPPMHGGPSPHRWGAPPWRPMEGLAWAHPMEGPIGLALMGWPPDDRSAHGGDQGASDPMRIGVRPMPTRPPWRHAIGPMHISCRRTAAVGVAGELRMQCDPADLPFSCMRIAGGWACRRLAHEMPLPELAVDLRMNCRFLNLPLSCVSLAGVWACVEIAGELHANCRSPIPCAGERQVAASKRQLGATLILCGLMAEVEKHGETIRLTEVERKGETINT